MSLAHPGRTGLDDQRISQLVAAGLDAIEVYHSDHDEADRRALRGAGRSTRHAAHRRLGLPR
jgi:predicted metal-dependent phosphoesterase TrpH